MNNLELLDTIAKGDTEDLLTQKNLTGRLNALAANGLVDICEGKICITPRGEQLQKKRRPLKAENPAVQKELEEFSRSTLKRNAVYVYLSLLLLCTAGVYLTVVIMQGQ